LTKSFYLLLHTNLGIQPEQVTTLRVLLPHASYAKEQITAVANRFLEEGTALPGVTSISIGHSLPVGNAGGNTTFEIVGQPTVGALKEVNQREVGAGYFTTLQVRLLRGRFFRATEDSSEPPVTIINSTMADRYFHGEDPIGKRINLCSLNPQPCWLQIVGIVSNIHQFGLDAPPTFDVYSAGGWTPNFVIRTSSDPVALAHAVTEEIHRIDPNLPVIHVTTLDGLLSETVAPRRFSTILLGAFALLALVLAAVGIYGVMAYLVSQRVTEIGIRMALGATAVNVLKEILFEGLRPAVVGILLGMAGAAALSWTLHTSLVFPGSPDLFYGVPFYDPATFLGLAVFFIIVAAIAMLVPGRRAVRVDPMMALRHG